MSLIALIGFSLIILSCAESKRKAITGTSQFRLGKPLKPVVDDERFAFELKEGSDDEYVEYGSGKTGPLRFAGRLILADIVRVGGDGGDTPKIRFVAFGVETDTPQEFYDDLVAFVEMSYSLRRLRKTKMYAEYRDGSGNTMRIEQIAAKSGRVVMVRMWAKD